MPLQSILFDKKKWKLNKAINWLKFHNYKYDVDITENKYRFRQLKNKKNKKYYTINIGNGIEYVIYNE